jgi:transposase
MIFKEREESQPMFHYFQMEDLVPENHILRLIDEAVDFSFVKKTVAHCYCMDNGRPAVDPELVVRMLLIGYLYDLSENRLCQEVRMHAAYRLFCHMTFEDNVPDRSTINKLRNHKWASSGLVEQIMHHIVQQCIDVGLVSGKHLSVDGTQIRANASVKSIEPIEPSVSIDDYLKVIGFNKTDTDTKSKDTTHGPQDKDFHGERWTNQTHRSTTDPDSLLYKKSTGKEALLSFFGNNLIDTKSRVILDTMATQATGTAEREAALTMIDTVKTYTMSHDPQILVGDTGYGSGDFIADLLDRRIIPHIPLRANMSFEPIPTWKNRTTKPHIQAKRDKKVREAQARNYVRSISSTGQFKLSQKLRKRNEHLFAEAKQQHGMRRARYQGLPPLQEQLYLTASVQNLKRLVAFLKRKKSKAQALLIEKSPFNSAKIKFCTFFNPLFRCIVQLFREKHYYSYSVI